MATLKPRARIVRTIGDQLISGPEAALIELVKNAFDADSPTVRIKITPSSAVCPSGAILVADRGHGMTHSDIVDRWFEPATDDKVLRRYSPSKRRMLGAKGIGRFAASRLGTKTILRSIPAVMDPSKAEEILVQIDWEEFSADRYLSDVEIPLVQRKVILNDASFESGVQLVISELRDSWSRKRVENLVRELRRVATPSDVDSAFKIFLDLSDFTIASSGFDGATIFRELNIDFSCEADRDTEDWLIAPFSLQEHADYTLRGEFDALGGFSGVFVVCKGDNHPQELVMPGPALQLDEAHCGPVKIEMNIYDRESESIEALFTRMGFDFSLIGIRAARRILTDNAGLAIFRNGFRIRPYGEPENDWLELERQRVQDPSRKLGLSQISGRVIIDEEDRSGLVERSSREGLEHNGQFERVKGLIRQLILHVEARRLSFREKAGLSRKRSGDIEHVKEIAAMKTVSRVVAKLPAKYRESVRQAIAKDVEVLNASLDEIDAYQKILQSRASLGLVVAQVIHEGRRILNPMAAAAKAIYDNHTSVADPGKRGEVYRKQFPQHAAIIQDGTKSMSRLFKRLDPVSGRRRGRPIVFSVGSAIRSCLALFDEAISQAGIRVHVDAGDPHAYGYAEDLQAALLNILENAVHWLSAGAEKERNLFISAVEIGGQIRVVIENDGPLINEDYVPRLFQPGFSLKADGTGLGLSIAREACLASKGDLLFDDAASNTRFVVIFPSGASRSDNTEE